MQIGHQTSNQRILAEFAKRPPHKLTAARGRHSGYCARTTRRDVTTRYHAAHFRATIFHISDSVVSVIQWSIPVEWEALIDLLGRHRAIATATQKACQCGTQRLCGGPDAARRRR